MDGNVKVAFPTDEHHPYADHKARDVALQIVSDFNPDIISAGSDAMDFYSISRFQKNPKKAIINNLDREKETWQAAQREWNEASPNAKRYYIKGNHEDRLIKYQEKHPEIYGLKALEFQNFFELSKYDIRMATNNEISVLSQLLISHGTIVRAKSGYTANAELEKESASITTITGHTHRGGSSLKTTRTGIYAGYEGYCLCDTNPDYIKNPNWQQGITLATCNKAWRFPQVEPITFWNKNNQVHAIWRDKHYSS